MIDLAALQAAVAAHGAVARVVVAAVAGSAPREAGAAMLVWAGGQDGTIGGGALEWEAAQAARRMIAGGMGAAVERVPLGPARGQCCGGAVTLVTEVWDAARLGALRPEAGMLARPVGGGAMPLGIARALARARGQGVRAPVFTGGWIAEPVATAARTVWVWGAGHVGRAVVGVIAPLPGLAVTWVDVAADRFPPAVPAGVTVRIDTDAALAAEAPPGAEHLVMTFSHALDLELCHRLLGHGFARCGLIGSATKWARFRSRLRALGHGEAAIARIDCPIGEPGLGKHPQAIAVGVAAALLRAGQVRQGSVRAASEG
ncbi:MAG: xanthine dehydrogenase accessory protein XdhC [Gemmobacter sp.]